MGKINKNYLLAGLSGWLLALAYPGDVQVSVLSWLGFVPLFWAISQAVKAGQKKRKLFYAGLVTGLVYFLIVFRWFWGLYPLDSFKISNIPISLVFIFLVWFISSAGMALAWGLFSLALGLLAGKVRNFSVALVGAPAIFIFIELVRAYFFGVIWYGPGSYLGFHWTFGSIAYALAPSRLALKLSSYFGIYGLSFLVILVNVLFYYAIFQKRRKNVKMIFAGCLIAFVLWFSFGKVPGVTDTASAGEKVVFATIQTDQQNQAVGSSADSVDFFKWQLSAVKSVITGYPKTQIIIFPEGNGFFSNLSAVLGSGQVKKYFNNLSKTPRLIVDSLQSVGPNKKIYSRVAFLNTQNDVIGFYDKKLLSPGGEFMPYAVKFFLYLFFPKTNQDLRGVRQLSAGQDEKPAIFNNITPQAIVCSDIFSPGLVRDKAKRGNLLVAMTSTKILHGNQDIIRQSRAVARFRAAENGLPLILVANGGISYSIKSDGSTDKMTKNEEPQILTGNVLLNTDKSWYNKVGDWPVVITAWLVSLLALIGISLKQNVVKT